MNRKSDTIGFRVTPDMRETIERISKKQSASMSEVVETLVLAGLCDLQTPVEERKLMDRFKQEVKGKSNVTDGEFVEILRDTLSFDDKLERVYKLDDRTLANYAVLFCFAVSERPVFKETVLGLETIAHKLMRFRDSGILPQKQAQNETKFTFGALDELYEVKKETIQKVEQVISDDIQETDTKPRIPSPPWLTQFRKDEEQN